MKKTAGALSVGIAGILTLTCGFAGQSLAECWVQVPLRPVHRTYIRRDVEEQGVYEVGRKTAAYGWTYGPDGEPRRVLLRPYKNITHFQRPYIAWSREHLKIQPEGYRWVRVREKPDC